MDKRLIAGFLALTGSAFADSFTMTSNVTNQLVTSTSGIYHDSSIYGSDDAVVNWGKYDDGTYFVAGTISARKAFVDPNDADAPFSIGSNFHIDFDLPTASANWQVKGSEQEIDDEGYPGLNGTRQIDYVLQHNYGDPLYWDLSRSIRVLTSSSTHQYSFSITLTDPPAETPEPATFALSALALTAFFFGRRRRGSNH